jgi:hypothetical protein
LVQHHHHHHHNNNNKSKLHLFNLLRYEIFQTISTHWERPKNTKTRTTLLF